MTTSLRTLRARELRKNQTEAESLLWQRLRNKQLNGIKFRRQHPIFGFIADFYCFELALDIELDGEVHKDATQTEQDLYRSDILEDKGITVIRFWNHEVTNDIEKVPERIVNLTENLKIKRGKSEE